MEKKVLKIVENGDIKEYEIILAFYWTKTKKNYIVYTDDTYQDNLKNIYAAIYYPYDDTRLDSIKEDFEWDEIDRRLKILSSGDNNE